MITNTYKEKIRSVLRKGKRIVIAAYKAFLPSWFYEKRSYAQEGEDLVLAYHIGDLRRKGFYVDIGAHHPFRFSNTCLFYKKGWRGINVDAMPGSMELFRKYRKRDVNLEVGVSKKNGELEYYCFNDPALNGFSKELSDKRDSAADSYKIIGTKRVQVLPLKDILNTHVPEGQAITFLSIDVEGMDLLVLQSNDWKKYRPRFLLVEIASMLPEKVSSTEIYRFLTTNNYTFIGKTYNTYLFKDKQSR